MTESSTALSAWESFYVIVGSSGGALIGLQFVVITLIAERRPLTSTGALSAFGTPTVVHFSGALLLSAVMSAPWHSPGALSIVVAIGGIAGIIYSAFVIHRAGHQSEYKPVWQDWIFYLVLPSATYVALVLSAVMLRTTTQNALFVIAGAALSLLLIGIHNAWDTVTHIVVTSRSDAEA